MMVEPEEVDWSKVDDVALALAANDGTPQAQAEQRRRAAAQKQRPARPIPDATKPRPLNY